MRSPNAPRQLNERGPGTLGLQRVEARESYQKAFERAAVRFEGKGYLYKVRFSTSNWYCGRGNKEAG